MNLTEKISYIRGLCDGLELDESKPEVKVLNAIVDLLDDMAFEVSDMEELYDELSAQVDEIDQDLFSHDNNYKLFLSEFYHKLIRIQLYLYYLLFLVLFYSFLESFSSLITL